MKLIQSSFKKLQDFKNIEYILFILSLIVVLFPVLTNKYFLTGDGPCHLYNSRILLDFITSNNLDFYTQYYSLNQNLEPNWFSHITLAFLLSIFPAYIAEKIFITAYIILFAIALKGLLKTINKNSSFLVFLGLPFMFHHTFQMGFFNYSFSFVFYFFTIRYWLKNSTTFTFSNLLILASLSLLLYFAHPIGWLLSILTIGLLIIVEFMVSVASKKQASNELFKKQLTISIKSVIAFLPAIILFGQYVYRKGLNPTPSPDSLRQLFDSFIDLTSLIDITHEEEIWAERLAIFIGLIFIYSIYSKIKSKTFNKYDAFFGVAVIMLIGYFNQPGGMAGAGILSIRLQFIPYLIIVLWFANIQFKPIVKNIILFTSIFIGMALTITRIPSHKLASQAAEEYISVQDLIEERSTVLPLSFSHNGKTPEGDLIADRIWLFMHASDYMGADKSLVLFGNYEGNTGFFPIIWNAEKNPYIHISTNEGIEHQPPSADILNYHKKTGGTIDYVITWCLDDEYMNHAYTQNILDQLSENYELVFTSENALAKLYKRVDK